jgi:ATP-dependent Lhr-like helicase
VYTEKPSPFTAELLFNFWQIYQYTYELPVAERRNQLLVKDRDFIQLAAGLNAEYELLDSRAIKAVEKELEKYRYNRKINNADDLWYFLYSFGELKAEPYSVSVFKGTSAEDINSYIEQLERQRRIIRVNIGQGDGLYWVAAEDLPMYCITSGRDPENETVLVGKPGEEREEKAVNLLSSYVFDLAPGIRDAAVRLIRRHIMFSGPFSICDISKKYGMKDETVADALQALVSAGEALKIKESDDPRECIYCHRKAYEKIKQRTVQLARKDIKPKAPEVYCTYLLNRHLVTDKVLSSEEKLIEVIKILNGQYFPAAWWEDFILPARINGYNPKMLDYLCVTGQVRWKGRLNKNIKETSFIITGEEDARQEYVSDPDDTRHFGNCDTEPDENPNDFTTDETEAKILEILDKEGAVFLKDLSKMMKMPTSDLLAKMERLVWCGIITNDSFSVARYYIDNERKNSPWTKYNTYPSMGRWSRAGNSDDSGVCGSIAGYINILLDRYGIVAKEIVNKEKCGFSWTEVYKWLKNNELVSGIKRGFYVSGLSAIQFMRDRDIELIRMMDDSPDKNEYVTLCSCDPANPYRDILSGAAVSRLTTRSGNAVVFRDGRPVLYIREYGHMMQPLTDDAEVLKKAAGCFVDAYRNRLIWTGKKNIFTEYWSDMTGEKEFRIEDSPIYADLQDLGYERSYSGMTLWKKAL